MEEPKFILKPKTRIRTSTPLYSTGGFLVGKQHIDVRKPGAIGAIAKIVPGHGGDVYFVAHIGDSSMAAYGYPEFELEPAKDPCPECDGSGIDWKTSHATSRCTACPACGGTAEKSKPRPSVYEHMKRNVEVTKKK